MATRRKKVLLIVGGVVLALVVLVILVLHFGVKGLKPQVEASASKALGMQVRIRGSLGVSLFPVFGASVSDISATKDGAEVASLAGLRIGLRLFPLIRGKVDITELELVKPVISVVRLKNGKLNIEPPASGSSSGGGGAMSVKKLSISQGTVRYADLASGQKAELDGIDLTVRDLAVGGPAGADMMKTLSFAGDLSCRTVKANDMVLSDLAVDIAGGKGVFDVSRARLKAFGGTGNGTLHADLSGTVPRYRIAYALKAFRIQDLLQGSANAKRMEGLADASADLAAGGNTSAELTRSLGGQVSLAGDDISVNGIDIDGLLGSLDRTQSFNLADAGGFFLAGPLGTALSRGANVAGALAGTQGGKSVITKLVSLWKVERGTAEAADVALATKKFRIAVKGGLNLVSESFENTVVAVLDDRGCATFSQKVHGTFAHPEVDKMSTLKSLAAPLTSLLGVGKKLVEPSKSCVPFYTGSVAPPTGGGAK